MNTDGLLRQNHGALPEDESASAVVWAVIRLHERVVVVVGEGTVLSRFAGWRSTQEGCLSLDACAIFRRWGGLMLKGWVGSV